jgi:riboflavin synthase
MFTGIIEGLGTIRAVNSGPEGGRRFTIGAGFSLAGTKIGDSIAVSGACLTAVSIDDRTFTADVSPETLSRSTFGRARTGERVNLERALRLSDRLDGHLVSGHIDGTGALRSRTQAGNALLVTIDIPPEIARYAIEKGSIAVDGISLTINQCGSDFLEVSIIPHTASLTTVGLKKIGDSVNLEADMIGKYVEKFLSQKQTDTKKDGGVDLQLLARAGYL